jgi:adhesin/invasin
MPSALWRTVPLVLILALTGCNGPSRGTNTQPSAASGLNLVVTVSPNTLHANGTSTAIVQAKVFDTHGNLVDGATVNLAASLGTITVGGTPAQGTAGSVATTSGTTIKGVLSATFRAGTVPGTSIITATVEDATATTLVTLF